MNLMNYSVVVIPVTKADKSIDVVDTSYRPLNPTDKMNWEACRFDAFLRLSCLLFLIMTAADDPDIYDGAPVGVQLVARKFEEEKILAIAKIVCAALNTAKQKTVKLV